jgi:hypothetical protein
VVDGEVIALGGWAAAVRTPRLLDLHAVSHLPGTGSTAGGHGDGVLGAPVGTRHHPGASLIGTGPGQGHGPRGDTLRHPPG